MEHKGFLVAVEGVKGCGKSTMIESLKGILSGDNVIYTGEPWTPRAKSVLAWGRPTTHDELAEAISDRAEHVREIIQPALDAGHIVICDRYYASTAVYQGGSIQETAQIFASQSHMWPKPDLWIVVIASDDVCIKRINARGRSGESTPTLRQLNAQQAAYGQLLMDDRLGRMLLLNGECERGGHEFAKRVIRHYMLKG